MFDNENLYRRIFLTSTFAHARDMPRIANAFHDLGEALVAAAGQQPVVADQSGRLKTTAPDAEAANSVHLERSFLRSRLGVAS